MSSAQKISFAPPRSIKSRAKLPLLLVGDIIVFYIALTLTLFIRYGSIEFHGAALAVHLQPFSIGLIAWLFVFYVGGMYERQIFNRETLVRRFFPLLGIGAVIFVLLFYFVPSFGIAPKANLFLFVGIFAASGFAWRSAFITILRERSGNFTRRIMLVGSSSAAEEVVKQCRELPQLGNEIVLWQKEGLRAKGTPEEFSKEVIMRGIQTIVIPNHVHHDAGALRMLYYAFMSGIEVIGLADLYESMFDRVSIAELEDSWLLKNLPRVAKRYSGIKYLGEVIFAAILLVILSPLMIFAGLAVVLTSRGGVFYRQTRVGQHDQLFTLYKFRTMFATVDKNPDAQAGAPTWSTPDDPRITPAGRILRATHIDELPQLFNILRGEMSFVGPRPERPEFTVELAEKIPYYELRSVLKPGITGWAQLNYPYGASVDDAYQKLQYEIYYLKNRSFVMDLVIVIKTLKRLFVRA